MLPDIVGFKISKAKEVLIKYGFSKLDILVINEPRAWNDMVFEKGEGIRGVTEESDTSPYFYEHYNKVNIDEVINFPDTLRIIRVESYTKEVVKLLTCRIVDNGF
jgi:hypothetical protein